MLCEGGKETINPPDVVESRLGPGDDGQSLMPAVEQCPGGEGAADVVIDRKAVFGERCHVAIDDRQSRLATVDGEKVVVGQVVAEDDEAITFVVDEEFKAIDRL